jgi:mannose-6-phosphate isomerase-like protein (cupin superfamily)
LWWFESSFVMFEVHLFCWTRRADRGAKPRRLTKIPNVECLAKGKLLAARSYRFATGSRQRRCCVTAVTRRAEAAICPQSSRLILVLRINCARASTIIQWRMSMTVWEAAAAATALLVRSGPNDDWQEVTPGERVKIHTSSGQTGGAFSLIEAIAEPGNGVPMHVHHNEDEHFIVLEGTFHVAVGNKRLDLSAGETITVAKGVAHAWCNASKAPVRVLAVFSPGGIEGLFREVAAARDLAEIEAIAKRYGTEIVGAPLHVTRFSVASPRIQA